MQSKITGGDTTFLFEEKVLNKYAVKYYRCNDTGFIQTEDPYWLNEAYSSAIANLDVGLVMRNLNLAPETARIINASFNFKNRFLDFAGGYGLFTRLMRDRGFNFYHTDKYCKNIFSEYFDLGTLEDNAKFELLTAFEVFEHLNDPLNETQAMFQFSDNILFSTELVPDKPIKSANDWWYFVPEIGQHIAFYTTDALKYIAEKNNVHFYSNGSSLHLFSKKQLQANPFPSPKEDTYLLRKVKKLLRKLEPVIPLNHEALLDHDIEFIKKKMVDS